MRNKTFIAFSQRQQQYASSPSALLLLSLALLLLSFPAFEPDFSLGLDSSYVWGMNYLFHHDYETLTKLYYTYGPLAFLRIPAVGNGNYAVFLVFFSLLKLLFIWLLLNLAKRSEQPLLLSLVALVPACLVANIDILLVFDVALLALLAIERKSILHFLWATILAVFALSIKSSIGIQCCMALFVAWLIIAFKHKDIRFSILSASCVPMATMLIALCVYHSLAAFWNAEIGMCSVVLGFSSAMVQMPEHRAWALLLFIVLLLAMCLASNNERSRLMVLIMIVPLFANWKYGIVREDVFHFKHLFYFVVCLVATIVLAQGRPRWPIWCCGLGALVMLVFNLDSVNTSNAHIITAKPSNFVSRVIRAPQLAEKSRQYISQSLAKRKLPDNVRELIADGSVDCYPWEHVYIAANNLQWQPHCSIELGSGNSVWLNKQAALNFSHSNNSVDYVILHRINYENDDGLQSLDGRYLLNDEPAIIDSIFSNYSLADSGQWYGLLLQKGKSVFRADTTSCGSTKTSWNEWITIPTQTDSVFMRMDVVSHQSVAGVIKSMLYKPDIYYIDYRMSDGSEHSYRYSPATATSGLWIGPLLDSYSELADFLCGNSCTEKPVSIRLRCASTKENHKGLKLQKNTIEIRFHRALLLSN